jgi:hypothetical protein
MPRKPRKMTPQLNVRISDEARRMFDEIEALTGLKDSALAHIFVATLQRHWEKHRRITLPFEFKEIPTGDEKKDGTGK